MSYAVRSRLLPLVLGTLVGLGVFVAESSLSVTVTDIGVAVLLVSLSALVLALPALLRRYPLVVSLVFLGGGLRALLFRPTPTIDDGPFYLFTAEQLLQGELVIVGHAASEVIWAIFVVLFSQSALNVAGLAFATATIPVVGVTAWRLFDSRRVGIAAMATFALAPLHIFYSGRAMNEPLALFFFGVAVYAIIADRLVPAAALTVVVAFMRIEYALAFLAPLLVYRTISYRSVRTVLVFGPLVLVGALLSTAVLGLDTSVLLWPVRLVGRIRLFSPVSIVRFVEHPIGVLGPRYQMATSHMVHWGVPYWNISLLNPLLPILAVVGVTLTGAASTRTTAVGTLTLYGFWVVFLQDELASGSLPLPLLVFSLAAFSMLVVRLYRADTDVADPFIFAYVYFVILVFLPVSGRYLLPIVFVLSIYAGLCLERLAAAVTRWDPQPGRTAVGE